MIAPRRTRIKFCGMTRAVDIERAVALGVDAVGLILVERSKRRLDVAEAKALRRAVPPFVQAVALTMDAPLTSVREILQTVRPDCMQFHGSEPDADCAMHGLRYLKAIPMADPRPLSQWFARYPGACGFVLDAHASGEAGGSGRRFDWQQVPTDSPQPIVLAGGLDPDNVFDAVLATRPFAVDVASGIEDRPGHKCVQRMARFVAEVRRADAALAQQKEPGQ